MPSSGHRRPDWIHGEFHTHRNRPHVALAIASTSEPEAHLRREIEYLYASPPDWFHQRARQFPEGLGRAFPSRGSLVRQNTYAFIDGE